MTHLPFPQLVQLCANCAIPFLSWHRPSPHVDRWDGRWAGGCGKWITRRKCCGGGAVLAGRCVIVINLRLPRLARGFPSPSLSTTYHCTVLLLRTGEGVSGVRCPRACRGHYRRGGAEGKSLNYRLQMSLHPSLSSSLPHCWRWASTKMGKWQCQGQADLSICRQRRCYLPTPGPIAATC